MTSRRAKNIKAGITFKVQKIVISLRTYLYITSICICICESPPNTHHNPSPNHSVASLTHSTSSRPRLEARLRHDDGVWCCREWCCRLCDDDAAAARTHLHLLIRRAITMMLWIIINTGSAAATFQPAELSHHSVRNMVLYEFINLIYSTNYYCILCTLLINPQKIWILDSMTYSRTCQGKTVSQLQQIRQVIVELW